MKLCQVYRSHFNYYLFGNLFTFMPIIMCIFRQLIPMCQLYTHTLTYFMALRKTGRSFCTICRPTVGTDVCLADRIGYYYLKLLCFVLNNSLSIYVLKLKVIIFVIKESNEPFSKRVSTTTHWKGSTKMYFVRCRNNKTFLNNPYWGL